MVSDCSRVGFALEDEFAGDDAGQELGDTDGQRNVADGGDSHRPGQRRFLRKGGAE